MNDEKIEAKGVELRFSSAKARLGVISGAS
jgi:hypothetical protein